MRRFLIATLTALALAFALAGCNSLHSLHVKVPRVPAKVHNLDLDTLKNIKRHANVEKYLHSCRDDQGVPHDC
jgi:hypothetical protein